jgi:hypothetical protein
MHHGIKMLPPGEKSYQPPQSSATNRLNTERIEEQGGRGSVLLSDPQAWGLLLGCGRTALRSLSRKGRDRVLDRSSTLIIAGRALVSVPAPRMADASSRASSLPVPGRVASNGNGPARRRTQPLQVKTQPQRFFALVMRERRRSSCTIWLPSTTKFTPGA